MPLPFKFMIVGPMLMFFLVLSGHSKNVLGDDESIPAGAVFENDGDWKFNDDRLVFERGNLNPDGRRFIRWKDYDWAITSDEITIIDPRPYGGSFTASRNQVDSDNKLIPEKKLMNDMKDEAKDLRKRNEKGEEASIPEYDASYGTTYSGPDYYEYDSSYYYGPSVSLGVELGGRHHHHHYYHHGGWHRRR